MSSISLSSTSVVRVDRSDNEVHHAPLHTAILTLQSHYHEQDIESLLRDGNTLSHAHADWFLPRGVVQANANVFIVCMPDRIDWIICNHRKVAEVRNGFITQVIWWDERVLKAMRGLMNKYNLSIQYTTL